MFLQWSLTSVLRHFTYYWAVDLVYMTDQVIIMGYPAVGLQGLYRNRREDAKKYLETRHGRNFWVFNLCPIRENHYSENVFDGRVSRYPFPDHQYNPYFEHCCYILTFVVVSRHLRCSRSLSEK